jgi:hypothetical protein
VTQRVLVEERARLNHNFDMEVAPTPARDACRKYAAASTMIFRDPFAKRASQNLTAAAILLRPGPEPVTPEEKKLRQHLWTRPRLLTV